MTHRHHRTGISIVYSIIIMVAICMFVSLAVDFGRLQLAKTELRRALDAAARAGASQLPSPSAARIVARDFASRNKVDGQSLALVDSNITFGTWNKTTKTFTTMTGFNEPNANAIRIVARRSSASNNGIPLMFASIMGRKQADVSAEVIVMTVPAVNVDQDVLATANPFLAGSPNGAVASLNNPHNSPDYAGTAANPRQSPMPVNALPLNDGAALNFDSIDGTVRHDPNLAYFNPDGELGDIGGNTAGAEHGKSNLIAPINALVGIFLDDNSPEGQTPPATLNFSSPTSRDFSELKPELRQIFFIGDGKDESGKQQNFIVPKGATRLFLATWDYYEWNNNAGERSVKVNRPAQLITVK